MTPMLLEGFKEDQNTVWRLAAYKKALKVFQQENPECVIYGEQDSNGPVFYAEPHAATQKEVLWMTRA